MGQGTKEDIMQPVLNEERNYANKLLYALKQENGENYKRLKDKAAYEEISLLAVLLQWGNPEDWFDKLKTCPFCGSVEIRIETNNTGIGIFYYGLCLNCSTKTGIFPTKKLAIKNWNTRYGL